MLIRSHLIYKFETLKQYRMYLNKIPQLHIVFRKLVEFSYIRVIINVDGVKPRSCNHLETLTTHCCDNNVTVHSYV